MEESQDYGPESLDFGYIDDSSDSANAPVGCTIPFNGIKAGMDSAVGPANFNYALDTLLGGASNAHLSAGMTQARFGSEGTVLAQVDVTDSECIGRGRRSLSLRQWGIPKPFLIIDRAPVTTNIHPKLRGQLCHHMFPTILGLA